MMEVRIRNVDDWVVEWHRHQAPLDDALSLALAVRHNLQDCLYLAAARRLDAELITADPTFLRRAEPHYGRVSLLPGCEPN